MAPENERIHLKYEAYPFQHYLEQTVKWRAQMAVMIVAQVDVVE